MTRALIKAVLCRGLAVTIFLLLWAGSLCAQPPSDSPSPKPPTPAPGATGATEIRESKPEVFYLRDKDGKLVPVPGFSYEEFRRLYDLDQKLASTTNTPPPTSIQQLTLTGEVVGEQARLELMARVVVRQTGWVRLPLKLPTAILRDTPKWDGPGQHFVDFERDNGFIVWLEGKDEKPHVLTMPITVPIRRVGDEWRLVLAAPKATSSQLTLQVPGKNIVPRINDGAGLLSLEPQGTDASRIAVQGVGGDLQLSWQESQSKKTTPAALEARGTVLVRVDDSRHITCEGRWKLNSFGGALETLRVRLPPGAELLPGNEPGYTVTALNQTMLSGANLVAREVEIRWDSRGQTTGEFRLRCTLPTTSKQTEPWWEVAGFEILGAVSHSGTIELNSEGDWLVETQTGPATHPFEETDATRSPKGTTRFAYDRQPFSLKIKVTQKTTQLTIEPRYLLNVSSQLINLEATFRCRVRGAAIRQLAVDMADWEIDFIAPEELLQVELLNLDKQRPLIIPLTTTPATTGDIDQIRIVARRKLAVGEMPLSVTLPKPIDAMVLPAAVAIVPDDNIELAPRLLECKGLTPDNEPPAWKLNGGQQTPLFFRDHDLLAPGRFVADVKLRSRSVEVAVHHQLTIEAARVLVEDRWTYNVAFEALGEVTCEVPQQLFNRSLPQWFWQRDAGAPIALDADDMAAEDATNASGATVRVVRLQLPDKLLGRGSLLARWEEPLVEIKANRSQTARLLLPRPVLKTEKLTAETLVVKGNDKSRQLRLSDDWQPMATGSAVPAAPTGTPNPLDVPEQAFASVATPREVSLALLPRRTNEAAPVNVKQGLVQTWLRRGARRDRAVFRLSTTQNFVDVRLPDGAQMESLIAALDGVRVEPTQLPDEQIRISLGEGLTREVCIELSYLLTESAGNFGKINCEFPQIDSAGGMLRFYWHLVVPRQVHLLSAPSGMTPELSWQWQDGFWERQANRTQAELESELGATVQAKLHQLPGEANAYLFSTFGSAEQVAVRTVDRTLVLLLLSGLALLLGIILLYVPMARHPASLLGLGVLAAALTFRFADGALFLVQGASVGIALAGLARVLVVMIAKRGSQRSVVRGTSLSGVDSRVTSIKPLRSESGTYPPFKSTAALGAPLPTADGKP